MAAECATACRGAAGVSRAATVGPPGRVASAPSPSRVARSFTGLLLRSGRGSVASQMAGQLFQPYFARRDRTQHLHHRIGQAEHIHPTIRENGDLAKIPSIINLIVHESPSFHKL